MTNLKNKIKQDYIELSQKDKHIQALIKKFEDGKATFNDVDSITKATGHALKTALEKNIAENPAAFADEEILADILRETFGDNYELINAVAADVQKRLDKVQGINIKPQKAEFPEERVDNLAKFTAKQDLTRKKSVSEVGAAAENLNNSMYTDYVKANADFRSRAGLKVYVIRTSDGKCCEWCDKQVGKYVYPDVPKDVWRRHKRCTCEITYVNERAGTYDRISYTDRKDGKKLVTNKQVTRLTPEQAAAKEREILDKKPLTFGRKSDIIKLDRKEHNTGVFSSLNIPMQKREVLSLCRKYSIDTKGITFKIQRSEKLMAMPFYGSTDYNNIGRIDLFPNAFTSEEELLKTILHEKCHVMQLRKHGKEYAQQNLDTMEKQAYRFESIFYNIIKKR